MTMRHKNLLNELELSHIPTSASLRRLLVRMFKTDAELDAFCLDYFPVTYAQFTDGMLRTRKHNLLLEHAGGDAIFGQLTKSYPEAVATYGGELQFAQEPIPAYRSDAAHELGERLQQLYEQKDEYAQLGQDHTAVDFAILEIRRQLRQGPQLQSGEFLSDSRFRLIQIIGKGGFATVWLAYDKVRRQRVAIKVLHGQWADDSQRLERFYRGARRMAEIQCPGVVRVLEEPQEEHGFHFFVMTYVPGGDLRQAIQNHLLTLEQGLDIIRQIGESLQYAHRHGIVHRDVKPGNILLGSEGPCLTDFDLAWAQDTTGGTNTGALGTFLYAAPEMMQDAQNVTPAVDVYSLAMTAIYILYGEEPVDAVGDRLGFLKRLIRSQKLLTILSKATERDPKNRYSSISEFCSALGDPDLLRPCSDSLEEQQNQVDSGIIDISKFDTKPVQMSDDMTGIEIDGYRLLRILKQGHFSDLYLAQHVKIGKSAIVKFLSAKLLAANEKFAFAQRFLNAARAVNQVNHPGMVDIFDFGQLSDGSLYLIMEYLKGETLRDRILKQGGKMAYLDSIRIARLIAESVAAVHLAGIVHRDLKPSNIMLISDAQIPSGERVKILDFGVAVVGDSRDLEKPLHVLGTFQYMAPEGCLGKIDIDGQFDVYSLGVMLMFMITGCHPFTQEHWMDLSKAHVHDPPPSLSSFPVNVPAPLSILVTRMLAKTSSDRPTMLQVAGELSQFEGNTGWWDRLLGRTR